VPSKEQYRKNPEKYREERRQYYWKHPEKGRAATRAWVARNHDHVLEREAKYREEHPDQIRQTIWKHYERNTLDYILRANDNRARRLAAPGHFTKREWNVLVRSHGHKCARCRKSRKLTVDHIVPLSKGGSNWISNIQPLCKSCNSAKGARLIEHSASARA